MIKVLDTAPDKALGGKHISESQRARERSIGDMMPGLGAAAVETGELRRRKFSRAQGRLERISAAGIERRRKA